MAYRTIRILKGHEMTAQGISNYCDTSAWQRTLRPYTIGSSQVAALSGLGLMTMGLQSLWRPELFQNPVYLYAGVMCATSAVVGLAGYSATHRVTGRYDDMSLENNIGRGLNVAAAATAGLVALAGFTANVPPATPLTTPPTSTFNLKSQNCQTAPVQKEIRRLEKAGYKVNCAPQ